MNEALWVVTYLGHHIILTYSGNIHYCWVTCSLMWHNVVVRLSISMWHHPIAMFYYNAIIAVDLPNPLIILNTVPMCLRREIPKSSRISIVGTYIPSFTLLQFNRSAQDSYPCIPYAPFLHWQSCSIPHIPFILLKHV